MKHLSIEKATLFEGRQWKEFLKIYRSSFKAEELDPISIYKEALQKDESRLHYLLFGSKVIGFYIIDVHENFDMLNHIAIAKEFRSQGLSNILMHHYMQTAATTGKFTVVEASDRLVAYYKRFGFFSLDVEYLIPSFTNPKHYLRYNLLCAPKDHPKLPISKKALKMFLLDIYDICYYLDEDSPLVKKVLKSL